jgi:repressor LexA
VVRNLYKKFQELLNSSEKTAYQVSKETGISTATLSNWKNGNYNPKVDKLKILADYFGVTLDYFIVDEKRNGETP